MAVTGIICLIVAGYMGYRLIAQGDHTPKSIAVRVLQKVGLKEKDTIQKKIPEPRYTDYLFKGSMVTSHPRVLLGNVLSEEKLRYRYNNDEGYKKIKETDRLPSEKVCRDLLKNLPKDSLTELREINKQLLELKSQTEDIREVCIDFDDTVVTIFGKQEGCGIGYNPRILPQFYMLFFRYKIFAFKTAGCGCVSKACFRQAIL